MSKNIEKCEKLLKLHKNYVKNKRKMPAFEHF